MAHSYVRNCVHIIFSTKFRSKNLSPEIRSELWKCISGIIRNKEMTPIAVGGYEDHCHVLVAIPSTMTVSKAAQAIKANSSKWLSETYPDLKNFEWQEGYSAFSVSSSVIPRVVEYIKNQEEHHKTKSFRDEYIEFLKLNNIEFDERHVLG
jgi:REP element-mobilizing transposase RayT